MIEHLEPKFSSISLAHSAVHEPRAAFLLNRFSETLPILYATHAAQFVLACDPEEAVGRSFYEFIDEGYLLGAINAIERAKENDSIAYLRLLWKRHNPWMSEEESYEDMEEAVDDEDGDTEFEDEDEDEQMQPRQQHRNQYQQLNDQLEVECLVSSSSDGLVVVVRRAQPLEEHALMRRPRGIFASPWATSPLAPYSMTPPPPPPVSDIHDQHIVENISSLPGPSDQEVMDSIRDVSVFVWSIAMLNDDVSQSNVINIEEEEIDSE